VPGYERGIWGMALILIIDDDIQVRVMLRKLFEREGYAVMDAPDGVEGIRRYQENPADLVIADLIMPNKEGIETIRELMAEFPEVKVIAISGGGLNEPEPYLHIAEKLGVKHTFIKPIETRELLEAVRELLG